MYLKEKGGQEIGVEIENKGDGSGVNRPHQENKYKGMIKQNFRKTTSAKQNKKIAV